MRSALQRTLSVGLLAAGLALASGCGSGSEQAGLLAPGSGSGVSGEQLATGPGAIDQAKRPSGDRELGVTVSAAIDGSKGGTVTSGRYSVWFAPGAFAGTQTISVTDTKSNDGQCILQPEGLAFNALVTLTIDVKNSQWDSPFATIEWWNPTTATWVDLHGIYSSDSKKVYTALQHFSTYRPRAGW